MWVENSGPNQNWRAGLFTVRLVVRSNVKMIALHCANNDLLLWAVLKLVEVHKRCGIVCFGNWIGHGEIRSRRMSG